MSYASNYNLNSRLSYLESLANGGGFPTSSNLQDVLDNGNSATNDITLNNTGVGSNVISLLPNVSANNPEITITDGTTTNTINKNGYTTRNSVQNSTHFLNFSDSSATGTGAIQKTAGLSCNPSTNTLTSSQVQLLDSMYGPLINFRHDTGFGLATKAGIRDGGFLITSGSSILLSNGSPMTFTGTTSGGAIGYINGTAGVPIQFNGATKFTTTNTGVSITGTTDTTTINNASGVAVQYNGTTQISTSSAGVNVPTGTVFSSPTSNNIQLQYFSPYNTSANVFSYWNFDIGSAGTSFGTAAGQRVYITPFWLPAGFTPSFIYFCAAATASVSSQVGIYTVAGTLLASSAFQAQTSGAVNKFSLTTTTAIPTSGIYLIGYICNSASNSLVGAGYNTTYGNYQASLTAPYTFLRAGTSNSNAPSLALPNPLTLLMNATSTIAWFAVN